MTAQCFSLTLRFSEVASMVVTWWIVAFLPSVTDPEVWPESCYLHQDTKHHGSVYHNSGS